MILSGTPFHFIYGHAIWLFLQKTLVHQLVEVSAQFWTEWDSTLRFKNAMYLHLRPANPQHRYRV